MVGVQQRREITLLPSLTVFSPSVCLKDQSMLSVRGDALSECFSSCSCSVIVEEFNCNSTVRLLIT